MDYLFFSIIQLINIYCLKRRPGIVLAYILFFQQFNKLIFAQIGFDGYRYITSIIFIPILFFLHYRRDQWHQIINNFFKSKITIGYFLFLIYMLFYSFYIGTQYEITYIKLFIFPGVILFIISAIFFFKMNMYRDLFYGIILFCALTGMGIILFNGLEALSDRTYR